MAEPAFESSAEARLREADGEDRRAPRQKDHHAADTRTAVPILLRRLATEAGELFRKELALAASEVTRAIDRAKVGAGAVATGGAVLHAGVLTLVAAAVIALAQVLEPWLAAAIVGVVITLIGIAMLAAGKRRLEPAAFAPVRTQHALHKDQDTFRRHRHVG